MLAAKVRGWLPLSIYGDDGLTRDGVIVTIVSVAGMAWALALLISQIAPCLGTAMMATIMAISVTIGFVVADHTRTGLSAYQIAHDTLGPIQRAALALPMAFRLSDLLGLPALLDRSLAAARRRTVPPRPALPACGIALTPRLSPIPVPAHAA
jgi:hypothetical protein